MHRARLAHVDKLELSGTASVTGLAGTELCKRDRARDLLC